MAASPRSFDHPTRLVGLGWVAGTILLAAGLMLGVSATYKFWLELLVLVWLIPLAAYDLQRKEVPHMACVGVPCLAAMVYGVAVGAWQVSVVAALVVAASERHAIRSRQARRWLLVATLLIVCLLVFASGEAAPGAIAVLGFWLAYELGWWAGADAMTAITLALLWPDIRLLVVLSLAHLSVAGVRLGVRWLTKQAPTAGMSQVSGIPVIGLAVVLLLLWRMA